MTLSESVTFHPESPTFQPREGEAHSTSDHQGSNRAGSDATVQFHRQLLGNAVSYLERSLLQSSAAEVGVWGDVKCHLLQGGCPRLEI